MRIVVVGDRGVSCELLAEAAQALPNGPHDIKSVKYGSADRPTFQGQILNVEKNGPTAEKVPDELHELVKDAEVLLVHKCPVAADLIDEAKDLKLIGTPSGGMEHIDVAKATERNIPVVHCIRNAEATSDFAVGLMFAETRNIARSHASIKKGEWRKEYVNSSYTTSMCDMTVGVVGLGHIGKLVAKKCLGIGMKVIGYDPFVTQAQMDEIGLDVKMVEEEELFKTADIVTLHLRVTPETKDCINEKFISLMKPTAYLINTSRAGVLKKDDFIKALQEKKIGGAALDVYWEEPIPEGDPLLELDNVTLTPHDAGNVIDALPKSPFLLVKKINEYLETGKSDMCVNQRNLK